MSRAARAAGADASMWYARGHRGAMKVRGVRGRSPMDGLQSWGRQEGLTAMVLD